MLRTKSLLISPLFLAKKGGGPVAAQRGQAVAKRDQHDRPLPSQRPPLAAGLDPYISETEPRLAKLTYVSTGRWNAR